MSQSERTLRDVETAELQREPYPYDETLVARYQAAPSPRRTRRRLASVAALCFVLTAAVTTVGRCLPLRMLAVGLGAEWGDWAVAALVGGMILGGCLLVPLLRVGRSHSVGLALLAMLVGCAVLCHVRTARSFIGAAAVTGAAYSFLLCILFDKAATLSGRRRSLVPAAAMIAALWMGIALVPLSLHMAARTSILPAATSAAIIMSSPWPLMIVAVALAALTILCTLRPHDFAFKTEARLYPSARRER